MKQTQVLLLARAWIVTVLTAGLVACGGEAGGDQVQPPPPGPPNGGSSDGGSAGGGVIPPAPSPSTPTAGTWGTTRTLAAGVSPLQGPELNPQGSAWMPVRTLPSGTVQAGTFASSGAYDVTATLADFAPGQAPSAWATRGDIFAATVTLTDTSTTPAVSHLNVALTGSGQPSGVTDLTPAGIQVDGAPDVHIDADGGVTVFWSEVAGGVSTLQSRRRVPGGTWGATATVASAALLPARQLLSYADGSGLLVWGRIGAGNLGHEVWGLPIDTQGQPGTPLRLDNPAQGTSDANRVQAAASGSGAIVMWPMALNAGGECLWVRTRQGSTWQAQVCVNTGTTQQGVATFGSGAYATDLAAVWWTTDAGDVKTSFLSVDGVWAPDETLVDGNTQRATEATLVGCPGGLVALMWKPLDGSALYVARRSGLGVWGTRVELVRVAGQSPSWAQARADDACRFTFSWAIGPTSGYDVSTRGWSASTTVLENTVVHATGVTLPVTDGIAPPVGMAVEADGATVLVWQDGRDDLTRTRRFE